MAETLLGIKHVLVVDEYPEVRDLMADVYRHWKVAVTVSSTAAGAIGALHADCFQLVVLSLDLEKESAHSVLSTVGGFVHERPGVVVTTTLGLGACRAQPRIGSIRLPVVIKPFCLTALRRASWAAYSVSQIAMFDPGSQRIGMPTRSGPGGCSASADRRRSAFLGECQPRHGVA